MVEWSYALSREKQMRAFFLLHEQYSNYRDEPAYTEVVIPFLKSGYVIESLDYVFQREVRQKHRSKN